MGDEWVETTLGEHIDIKHGFAFRGEFFREQGEGDVLVTPGNFRIGGGFTDGKLKRYVGPEVAGYLLPPGEIIVTMTDLSKAGDTLGFSARVPADGRRYLHNQRIGRVVQRQDGELALSYANWLMRTADYRHHILGGATGSTVKHTSPSRIQAFRFNRPPIGEQLQIAGFLDSLEEKIELNRRMAATLTEIARVLFRSWFVDFDPVHAKMEDRDPGLPDELANLFPDCLTADDLPAGWGHRCLDWFAQQHRETMNPAHRPDENFSHFSLPAFDGGMEPALESGSSIKSQKLLVSPGLLLVSKLNPDTPRIWLVPPTTNRAVASTEFIGLQAVAGRSTLPWLWGLATSAPFRDVTSGMVTGTSKSHQRVQPAALLRTEWPYPGWPLVQAYDHVASPLLVRAQQCRNESRTLVALRDKLLPKLITGKLRVAEADAWVEEAA